MYLKINCFFIYLMIFKDIFIKQPMLARSTSLDQKRTRIPYTFPQVVAKPDPKNLRMIYIVRIYS